MDLDTRPRTQTRLGEDAAAAARHPEPAPGCEACGASMRPAPELERKFEKPPEQPL